MNSKERLAAALTHHQPDRVCVDFGATWISGIHIKNFCFGSFNKLDGVEVAR